MQRGATALVGSLWCTTVLQSAHREWDINLVHQSLSGPEINLNEELQQDKNTCTGLERSNFMDATVPKISNALKL